MDSQANNRIVSLQLCAAHRQPMKTVESINLITGVGIEDDNHATASGARTRRQVLLMDEETLEAFGLERGQIRENITTSGIELAKLKAGQRVGLGSEVVLEITGHCAPCEFIEAIRPGLRKEMEGKRGMLAFVVQGGAVRVGDGVRVLEPASAG